MMPFGLTEFVGDLVRRSPIGHRVAHAYPYNFQPHQLVNIVSYLDKAVAATDGSQVTEVGCCYGHTSIFLATHLATVSADRALAYHAYDTFDGFPEDDIEHELKVRGLGAGRREFSGFDRNSLERVRQNVLRNASKTIPIELHKADVSIHSFEELADVVFVLIDVDLYLPTKNALEMLWPKLQPGAIVVCDDCQLDGAGAPILDDKFSGGHAALLEFAAAHDLSIEYAAAKLAVIRK